MSVIPRPPAEEHDELELPPLDGEEEEREAEIDETIDELEGDAFDDAEGGDAFAEGALGEIGEERWLDDSEADAGLEVGESEGLVEEGGVLDGADAPGTADEMLDVDESDEPEDAGDEGPTAPDEELREEDLPALDADDEGLFEDEELLSATDEEDELVRAPRMYERVGASRALGDPQAIAAYEGGALVSADGGLWLVSPTGEVAPVSVSPGARAALAKPPPSDLSTRAGAIDGSLLVVETDPAGARIVYELYADSEDAPPATPALIARDPAAGLVWLATPRGVVALRAPSA
jgi:hypothetical protein